MCDALPSNSVTRPITRVALPSLEVFFIIYYYQGF